MTYLLLSIASSSLIFVIFKLFAKYKINTLQAIVVNYFVAFTTGIVSYQGTTTVQGVIDSGWFTGALSLGFVCISVFNLMAITTQKSGLSVVSVATKMSVIIPVIFGIYVCQESFGFQKVFGIALALLAVYLTTVKSKSSFNFKQGLIFPFLL